jgi:hypothetical protein
VRSDDKLSSALARSVQLVDMRFCSDGPVMESILDDKKKAIIIGVALIIMLLLAFSLRKLFYNSVIEMQLSRQYHFGSLQTVNIIGIFIILGFSTVFSVLGSRTAKEKGYSVKLWAFICFITNLWGYLYLLLRKRAT